MASPSVVPCGGDAAEADAVMAGGGEGSRPKKRRRAGLTGRKCVEGVQCTGEVGSEVGTPRPRWGGRREEPSVLGRAWEVCHGGLRTG